MDHLTEQDAGLLEQAASMLEGLANDERNRGNCSGSEGAACSAHAIRRLAPALLRAGAAPAAVAPQGVKFFSASNEGLDEHDTAEAAQNEAQSIIDMYREEAADGWPEEVDSVCWGVILGKAVERPVKDAPFMAGILGSDMEPVDYVLEPVAAPALEAPAAPCVIDIGDNGTLRSPTAGAAYWALYRGDVHIRYLDKFEENFVNSAIRAALSAAPQAPNCTRCSGSGEDPEGYLTHGRGPDDHAVDGPCRSCDGSGAAPQAPAAPSGLPSGWVPCIVTHDGQHPEEVAYGPQIMMDRLKKWLGRYFELLAAPAAPAVDAQGERDAAFEAVRQRLCRIPRWSFHIDSRGNIRRVDDASGNWIEFSAAHELFDPVAVDAACAAQAAAKGAAS